MFLSNYIKALLLQSLVTAEQFASGSFLMRITPTQWLRVHYCYTELPYSSLEQQLDEKCLFSGYVTVTQPNDVHAFRLPLENITSERLRVELEIKGADGRSIQEFKKSFVIDGALAPTRIGIPDGTVMEFLTVCDKTLYGRMCSRKCVETAGARYVCGPDGEKWCYMGWKGAECNIAEDNVDSRVSSGFITTRGHLMESTTSGRLTGIPSTTFTPSERRRSNSRITEYTTMPVVVTKLLALTSAPKRSSKPISERNEFFAATDDPAQAATQASDDRGKMMKESSSYFSSTAEIDGGATLFASNSTISLSTALDLGLLLFLLSVLAVVAFYFIVRTTRSPYVQNWINKTRARIFANFLIQDNSKIKDEITKKSSKVFVIDVDASECKHVGEEQPPTPRYSTQPRRECYEEQFFECDVDLMESHSYHEIESFLQCSEARQGGTLV